MGVKRPRDEMEGKGSTGATSPFMPMFEHFRSELDEHHDRRERIIKASRDITAASKKIIFTLQRIRQLGQSLPHHVTKDNKKHHETIAANFSSVSSDLRGINAHRYARNISGGCQEWMEACAFEHYLTSARLITLAEGREKLGAVTTATPTTKEAPAEPAGTEAPSPPHSDDAAVLLSHEDYLLGIYDTTGELMRFAITAMATSGALPAVPPPSQPEAMDDSAGRNILTDLRGLRSALETLETRSAGPFARDVDKKMDVMKASVEKVEKALYGLVVRGAERPKGWMPDLTAGASGAAAVEVEG